MSEATERAGLDPTDDETPLGDTNEHADTDQHHETETGRVQPDSGRVKRDPVGGEAEAEPAIPADPPRSE